MPIKIEIKKISPHIIWMMALLELITVPIVVIIPKMTNTGLKNPLHGIIIGFIGVTVLLYCINRFLGKLNFHLGEYRISGISIFASAFWSGLILAIIFGIQHYLKAVLRLDYPIMEMASGFFSVGGAMLSSGLIYRAFIRILPFLSIKIDTKDELFIIENYSLLRISLLAGVYEAIALPIILIWTFYPAHQAVAAAITGIVGGLIGGFMIWLLSVLYSASIGWISLCKADPIRN
jgi:hypothetical protein